MTSQPIQVYFLQPHLSQPFTKLTAVVHLDKCRYRIIHATDVETLLLVDDEPLYREGLRNLLASRGIQVVGTADDGFDALEKARSLRPDIVLMDIQMPRCDGLQATALIKAELPDVKVVILTVSARGDDLFTALRSGASSYLLKTSSADEMLDLLSEVARGEAVMPRGLATKILAELVRQGEPKEPDDSAAIGRAWELSARQLEVLTMVAQGMTYKEVGAALSLAESTVKFHMGQILEHLHLKNRAEAVALARRAGVLPRPDTLPSADGG